MVALAFFRRPRRQEEEGGERVSPPPEEFRQAFQVDPSTVVAILQHMYSLPPEVEGRTPWSELDAFVSEAERRAIEAVFKRFYTVVASTRRSYGSMLLNTSTKQTLMTSVKLLLLNDISLVNGVVEGMIGKIWRSLSELKRRDVDPETAARTLEDLRESILVLLCLNVALHRILKDTESLVSLNLPFQAKPDLARNILGYTAVG
ncbi:MAG: hypothetical protein QW067_09260 [Thermofilaceae archaeon]